MNRAMWMLRRMESEYYLAGPELSFESGKKAAPPRVDPSYAAGAKVLAALAVIAAEVAPFAPPLSL